jgi:hypothetical protein
MNKPKTITIDDEKYVRLSDVESAKMADVEDGKTYCIIRTYSSGVFAGYIGGKEAKQGHFVATIFNSRRLHQWYGASLSQVAIDGFVDPSKCRVAMVEPKKDLPNIIEIISCTERAKKSIESSEVWRCK